MSDRDRVKEGDTFRTKDGVRLVARLGISSQQVRAYNLGMPGFSLSVDEVRALCILHKWSALGWDIEETTRKNPAIISQLNSYLVLCPVNEDGPQKNEFGVVTP